MALTLVQLGPAHRGVRCDRVHEVVYPGPPGPVLEKGFVADDGIFPDAAPATRGRCQSAAGRFSPASRFEHDIRVFLRLQRRVRHAQVGQEGSLQLIERDLRSLIVDFCHRLHQPGNGHVATAGVIEAGDLEVGVVFLSLALEHELHVVVHACMHVARGIKCAFLFHFEFLRRAKV